VSAGDRTRIGYVVRPTEYGRSGVWLVVFDILLSGVAGTTFRDATAWLQQRIAKSLGLGGRFPSELTDHVRAQIRIDSEEFEYGRESRCVVEGFGATDFAAFVRLDVVGLVETKSSLRSPTRSLPS
jgi:hypothetical protein